MSNEESDAAVFADRVRRALTVARRMGLDVPAFRSPPKARYVDRAIRRRDNGDVVVSIRIQGRTVAAIEGDIIDGIVAANLPIEDAGPFRAACREAFDVF